MIRILLVDDHIILRAGLRAIIENIGRYIIAGEAENGMEALHFLKMRPVDIVLTDIQMPVMDGISCTRKIAADFPDTRVIAVTMHSDKEYIHSMLDAGASGYILKDAGSNIIQEAIDTVYSGDNYFGWEIENAIKNAAARELNNNRLKPELSEREIDVLRLIVQEKSNSEIANKLFISIRTVDAHRRNLLKKTGCRNSVGLTKYALKNQLLIL